MENNIVGDSMFLELSLAIFFVLFLVLFIPSTIHVNLYITCDRYFLDIKKQKGMESKITFKLCGIIPVFYKKILEAKKVTKKQKENKIKKVLNDKETIYTLLNKSYIDKFILSLGFNLNDPIANSYVNATLNTIICLYINLNQDKFNMKRLYYQTYIGENLANLNFEGIIKISLADTIKVIVKQYFRLLKREKNSDSKKYNSKMLLFKKRREEYGRASD